MKINTRCSNGDVSKLIEVEAKEVSLPNIVGFRFFSHPMVYTINGGKELKLHGQYTTITEFTTGFSMATGVSEEDAMYEAQRSIAANGGIETLKLKQAERIAKYGEANK